MSGGRDIRRLSHELDFCFALDPTKLCNFWRKHLSPFTGKKIDVEIEVGFRHILVIEEMERAVSFWYGCECRIKVDAGIRSEHLFERAC